jgi:hypothetical protein
VKGGQEVINLLVPLVEQGSKLDNYTHDGQPPNGHLTQCITPSLETFKFILFTYLFVICLTTLFQQFSFT